ncbi:YkvA family protein [Rhizobium sp. L1K21]|uniref:YkvA family protein n=1 Tax=Rhizobium sp. L1K21 TaxID=2954933 RepID=UPI002092E822|nr:YkvA family protein [Rhizobium sp. L1K21]MCO6184739.1 YkvA family protein [Rhizobium sp. L1K21]
MDDVKYGDILEPGTEDTQRERAETVKKGFWTTFKKAVRRLPFGEDVVAAYFCAFDPQTPIRTKGILLAALAYFVMPFDAVPDFIALVGFSDDLAVLAAAISAVRSQMRPEHYDLARQALEERQ